MFWWKCFNGHYETSTALKRLGVISGKDITIEAAIGKLMFMFRKKYFC